MMLAGLAVGVFLSSVSFFVIVPLLPLYMLERGISDSAVWSGVIIGVSFLLSALSSPLWGSLADRYGAKPMILRSAIGLTVVYYLITLTDTKAELFAVRCLNGLMAGFVPAAMTLASRLTDKSRMGRTMSVLSVARASGAMLGPAFAGLVASRYGLNAAFLGAAAMMALSVVVTVFLVPGEPRPAAGRAPIGLADSLRQAARVPALRNALAFFFLCVVALNALSPIIPLHLRELTGDTKQAAFWTGVVFAIGGSASIVLGYPWGWLTDLVGYRRLLPAVLILAAGAASSQAFVGGHVVFVGVYAAYAALLCELTTLLNVYLAAASPDNVRGQAFALGNTSTQLALAFGPTLGGLLGGAFGTRGAFPAQGALLLACGLLFIVLARRERAAE